MANEKTTLLLIRHAETEWNKGERIQGHLDSPLTRHGEEEAACLWKRLQKKKIDVAFSSDAPRCIRTSEIALEGTDLRVSVLQELRERNLGAWEGLFFPDLKSKEPAAVEAYYNDPNFKPAGGENWPELQSRVMSGLKKILADHEGKTIAVFTSGGPVKAALLGTFGIPPETWSSWRTSNTSISILEKRKGRWRVNVFNDTSHLLKE